MSNEAKTNGGNGATAFLIPPPSAEDTKPDLRRVFRSAVLQALTMEGCAKSIAPFMSNGNLNGHKLYDAEDALDALVKTAPDNLRLTLSMNSLNRLEKVQAFVVAVRSRWVLDKHWKTDGITPNPKLLLRQEKAKAKNQAAAAASQATTS